ncbi:hypothetical protein [uncultured Methylobacterium sp.]|jgi:hypothetical protein|uniref:hypothetical protein n=1 Tax=uncultured Methylobacterium sp. TaxID=157278 RepID=UPI00261A96A4|nr:hypothetical protein [uncultured Methylobacterium sp.]
MFRPDPAREAILHKRPDAHPSHSSRLSLCGGLWIKSGRHCKSNNEKYSRGINVDLHRIKALAKLALVLIGMSVLLPACVSTGGSTSGHVDAKLREHGV